MMLESPAIPQTDLESEFEIRGELGRGGMAVVYLAKERALGREVAIKVVRARYLDDDETRTRFEREARISARLTHPNIVTVHGLRRLPDDSLALVLQYVPGQTLADAIRERGPLPTDVAVGVLRDVGAALAYAHASGVVHRDVKPDNIFIESQTGRALLADFGIAVRGLHDTRLTVAGSVLGTPTYMSPEQIDGAPVDGRSDLYMLALVGWEMLSGRTPWADETFYGVLHNQKHQTLPPLDTFRADVPPRLARALEIAQRKDPAARWASVDEFLARLPAAVVPMPRREPLTGPALWPPLELPPARRTPAPDVAAETVKYIPAESVPMPGTPVTAPVPVPEPIGAADPDPAVVRPHRWTWLRWPWLVRRTALYGERQEITVAGHVVGVLISPADLARLEAEEARVAAAERVAAEALAAEARLARLRLDCAGPGEHAQWSAYPHGREHYALLMQVAGMNEYRADTILSSYGSVDVFLDDTPAGVDARTGGAISASRAEALLSGVRANVMYLEALNGWRAVRAEQ
jgi:serine/threonine protein kinase